MMHFKPCAVTEVVDALTGAPLTTDQALLRCTCGCHYTPESHQLLKAENAGQCAACGSTAIQPVPQD